MQFFVKIQEAFRIVFIAGFEAGQDLCKIHIKGKYDGGRELGKAYGKYLE